MTTLVEGLCAMPLFEALTHDQLAWLSERGTLQQLGAGEVVHHEGDPAESFWVLVEGELQVSRRMGTHEVVLVTSDAPGAWVGAVPSVDTVYQITSRVLRPSRLFRIPFPVVEEMLRLGFPITKHLLAGMNTGVRNMEALARQQDKLESLGKLSAGMAHEINNPAAAARRAAEQLREVLADQQAAAVQLVGADGALTRLGHPEVVDEDLGPLQRADREDELAAWLEAHGVENGYEIAPSLVDVGVGVAWLEAVAAAAPSRSPGPTVRWLVASITADRLVDELASSIGRVTELVDIIKSYSHMDRDASLEEVDIHRGLDTTLAMLRYDLRGVEVHREYDPNLPPVPGYGSSLNQVWTNLIDNAADVLGGKGHLWVRTELHDGGGPDGATVVVEVADDGPGIPEDIQAKVFDVFFTTKTVGQGTGLGLDTSRRIVEQGHHGRITVSSVPGDTRFRVRLPLQQPLAGSGALVPGAPSLGDPEDQGGQEAVAS